MKSRVNSPGGNNVGREGAGKVFPVEESAQEKKNCLRSWGYMEQEPRQGTGPMKCIGGEMGQTEWLEKEPCLISQCTDRVSHDGV